MNIMSHIPLLGHYIYIYIYICFTIVFYMFCLVFVLYCVVFVLFTFTSSYGVMYLFVSFVFDFLDVSLFYFLVDVLVFF